MDKILITTDHPEPDDYLVQCLNLLFPESKVEVKQRNSKTECTKSQNVKDDETTNEGCSDLQASAGG
jgi:hypothetical protein